MLVFAIAKNNIIKIAKRTRRARRYYILLDIFLFKSVGRIRNIEFCIRRHCSRCRLMFLFGFFFTSHRTFQSKGAHPTNEWQTNILDQRVCNESWIRLKEGEKRPPAWCRRSVPNILAQIHLLHALTHAIKWCVLHYVDEICIYTWNEWTSLVNSIFPFNVQLNHVRSWVAVGVGCMACNRPLTQYGWWILE